MNGRVLVVEDDPDIGRLLLVLLGRAGLDATLCTDGVSGLRGVTELAPDLLVMDVGLPGLDGWAVLERIRAAEAAAGTGRLPVLLVSAHAQESDRNRGLALGADEVVLKPFANDDLLARVRGLLPDGT
ncbi:MAG TPA: response regulator [Mycobacteriales bacterium]